MVDACLWGPPACFHSRFSQPRHPITNSHLSEAFRTAHRHFYQPSVSPMSVRSRLRPDPADVLAVLSQTENFPQNAERPDGPESDALSLLGIKQRGGHHDDVAALVARTQGISSPLLDLAGFIASIMTFNQSLESRSRMGLRTFALPDLDQPHFYHLLDELYDVTADLHPPLLRLTFDKLDGLMKRSEKVHRIVLRLSGPERGYDSEKVLDVYVPPEVTIQPELVPVPEGFDASSRVDDTRDVFEMICEGDFNTAITKCTRLMRAHPNRVDLAVYRSIALVGVGKDVDALLDVQRALQLEDTQILREFRNVLSNRLMGGSSRGWNFDSRDFAMALDGHSEYPA
jgi:hypothetical protein